MSELQYTTVDRIFSKLYREIKGTQINETDAVEWIGEALEFLRVYPVLEEAVTFLQVQNYEAVMPQCLVMIHQIARNNNWDATEEDVVSELEEETSNDDPCATDECGNEGGIPLSCQGEIPDGTEYAYYRPVFDLVWEYELWRNTGLYTANYTPVRLADHTFFNTVVDTENKYDYIYRNCVDEYTIIGSIDRKLRFSFEDGFVAVSYLRSRIDNETGYPLVPDQISFITAIGYYIKWKVAEWWEWNGRKGAGTLAQSMNAKWLKYAKQAKNFAKMPKSLDKYQNLFEQSRQIVPLTNRYFNYFRKPDRS